MIVCVPSKMNEFANCNNQERLDGKVAIVTGATSGMGLQVAKNLSKRGAKVIIVSKNKCKLDNAREEISKASGRDDVIVGQVDFVSLSSVRNFVDLTMRTEPKVDILINNIGAIGLQDRLTQDGLQTMMQVNYFGTFLLTYLLFPLLKKSAPSRIVNVSSLGLLLGDVDFNKWNAIGAYSNFGFYCNAKLLNVLFTAEMARRTAGSGVTVVSMDPGLIKTEFLRNLENEYLKLVLNEALLIFGRPTDRVAMMPVYLAVDTKVKKRNGAHFRDCTEFYSHWSANDTLLTGKLWKETKKLVRIELYEDWG